VRALLRLFSLGDGLATGLRKAPTSTGGPW
jgi:hypothetical protein